MRRWLPIALVLAMAVMLCASTPVAYKHPSALATKYGAPTSPTDLSRSGYELPPVGSRNPHTLDDVVLSEGFETTADNALPTGWTQVDVDNGYCTQFTANSRWRVQSYYPHSGSKICFNHYNDSALPNNDWLILPQQNLTGTITLSYWIASQDPLYLESYEVKVSTTGTQPANFTNLIYSATSIPTTYTQHTHDLSAYAGAPFYIAFHYNAIDEFVIRLDDVVLEAGAATPRGAISGVVTEAGTGNPLQNTAVAVLGTSLTATTNASGAYIITGIPVDTYSVSFQRTGYVPMEIPGVIVIANDTVEVNAVLQHTNNVIEEDFEAVADNALPVGWTQVDVDGGSCTQFSNELSQWRARTYSAHSGVKICFNHYNDGALPNNDWLILPQQNLSGTISLGYWIASQDANYLESYEVRVSTTGTLPANFTNLIYSGTSIPVAFTQHTHDLSAYAGMPIYIAFHYNSIDEFVIRLDDVTLSGTSAPGGTIRGVINNSSTSLPIEGAAVAIIGTALNTTTNSQGLYAMTAVPADTYSVRFTKAGYDTLRVDGVIVTVNDTVTLNVNLDPSGVENNDALLPASFAFYGNYPNPFNARTEFRFAVDRTGPVELVLYNLIGQEAARVVDEVLTAGVHTVAFNAADLPSGLYLARLTSAGHTAVQKTMLLK
jgi:hypothetical protein